jgi:cytochrome P450
VAPAAPQPGLGDRLIPAFHDAAARRIAQWDAEGFQSRNLLVDFRALTLAIAARAMFSIEDDRRTAELANLMNEGERQTSFLHWSDFLFLLLGRGIAQPSVRRAFGERWRGWMVSFLENRPPLAQLDEARDLLDLLRTARDQGGGGPFQAEVIVDQVGTMMAAGFETTAVALFWIALLLAFFPNQQEAARGELCAESVDAPPEAQFLRSLATTTAFVYEALRLYPPVYTFSRQAAVDDRIGDLSIPRGATITISPWLLHRHQRHWSTRTASTLSASSATAGSSCPRLGCRSALGRASASAWSSPRQKFSPCCGFCSRATASLCKGRRRNRLVGSCCCRRSSRASRSCALET